MSTRAPLARDEWLLPTLAQLLTPEQLACVRGAQGGSYWDAATRLNFTTDERILAALAERFRMEVADLQTASRQAVAAVPEDLARKYRIAPLTVSDTHLQIATSDPHDRDCERTLAFALGRTVRMTLASPAGIAACIDELYRPEHVLARILDGVTTGHAAEAPSGADDERMEVDATNAAARPVIRLVDYIIAEGIQHRASDIHLEPGDNGIAVRYRIDGVLRQVMLLPRAAGTPLVSRIKIMASLDIADRLRPQDGRARVAVDGGRIDLRVSTLPAAQGEKVVIRILDQRATALSLDAIGLESGDAVRVRALLEMHEGLVLVTGPTGSGKTTTLYSALRHIQERGVNIVAVEDPVEYRLPGIVQVQVNEKTGLTFAAALRSILRQDPDVMLVGEIRDRETAMIAVQASLTGHLVLSTLHTIDAPSAIARLADLGVEPYKIAAALKGVIAQRLVRRLCGVCREPQTGDIPVALKRLLDGAGASPYRAVGCPDCAMTGYRGRVAIAEVLVTSEELERRVTAGESPAQLLAAAREGGMRALWESGVARVRRGDTSIEEVLRVLEVPVLDHRAVAAQVLLAGHQEAERAALTDALVRGGFVCHEAMDDVTAINAIDRVRPDIVVLDIDAKLLDGYKVLRHVRAHPATRDLPVIALGAPDDGEREARVFESGATDYVAKPIRPRALAARLRARLPQRSFMA